MYARPDAGAYIPRIEGVIARYGVSGKKGGAVDRLLILACSQRKVPVKGYLPAIDRYDGPAFRVLRKYLRETSDGSLAVLILSARYGLIESERKIPWYDQRLSDASAARLRPQVLKAAKHVLRSHPWHAVGLCAGTEYRSVVGGLAELIPEGTRLDLLAGGLGKRLAALRDWLRQ
jgi:hypothetical protein